MSVNWFSWFGGVNRASVIQFSLTCHSFIIHFTINPKIKASFFEVLSFINSHLTVIEKMGGEKGEKFSV